ncbi:phage portal protein [Granulicella cerasi]|uniref:Phage portal protein n=1 Tax=Granulicella cerasi TaxID=741063 RepID=A0ABW1ZBW6_9BACT|nr:phage portal protein [Granulicella cerasi]
MGWKDVWSRVAKMEAEGERKTVSVPRGLALSPTRVAYAAPKPTVENLRRFAETPVARRALNYIKNRIASMEWRVEPRVIAVGDEGVEQRQRVAAVVRSLQAPNASDSFQTLLEQVIEDILVGGFGSVEMELSGDARRPVNLYPVDGATVQVNAEWNGDATTPHYAQMRHGVASAAVPLLDDELMYVRLNPRTHTVLGLGKLEVAFEAITQFFQAHRYAGKLAANGVAQYALWMKDRTPEQQERLIRWWQDEVEGTGRVPVLSCDEKPEVLRFAGGTDADLHLQWQQFLLAMIANAFDLPPMMLGVLNDVNRSTAAEMADEAFQNAVVPLARLIAEHVTRDVIGKRLGWDDLRFVWSELESRDEMQEIDAQLKMLAAKVLTVADVRAMRGLPALPEPHPPTPEEIAAQKQQAERAEHLSLFKSGVLTRDEVRERLGLPKLVTADAA